MGLLNIFVLLFTGFLSGPSSMNEVATMPTVNEVTQNSTIDSSSTARPTSSKEAVSVVATEQLAKCLADKGAIMYGAYWCPHCADQKKLFGDSFKLIHYQECDAKGPNGNPAACKDAEVKAYPTWAIPGSANLEGTQQLVNLAKASNCPLT